MKLIFTWTSCSRPGRRVAASLRFRSVIRQLLRMSLEVDLTVPEVCAWLDRLTRCIERACMALYWTRACLFLAQTERTLRRRVVLRRSFW